MKLINGTIRPGQVLEVLENGNIKASAPGLFASQDQDNLPPIMPFFEIIGSHANSFSTPVVGDEVWILNMTDNPLQLYWFRKDDHANNNKEIFKDSTENVEIICNRETGMSWATLYFSDGSGWVLRNDDSKLQIFPDGHIEIGMNWPNRTINIDSNAIHLGNSDKEHSACYGDETANLLFRLCAALEVLSAFAEVNPYTAHLSTALQSISSIKNDVCGIMSPHVKID